MRGTTFREALVFYEHSARVSFASLLKSDPPSVFVMGDGHTHVQHVSFFFGRHTFTPPLSVSFSLLSFFFFALYYIVSNSFFLLLFLLHQKKGSGKGR